jgi:hypothetical protein
MKILISITAIFLMFFGCKSNSTDSEPGNNFSIYLTKNVENNSPAKISLDKIILEDEPIIAEKSVEYYEWANHKLRFSNEAKEKIKLKEPLFGRYFIIIASNQRVYWGLFTDGASSMGCNNPVIMVLSRTVPKDSSFITNEFVIDRAYPAYIGNENDKDLREDQRVFNALKADHKLK